MAEPREPTGANATTAAPGADAPPPLGVPTGGTPAAQGGEPLALNELTGSASYTIAVPVTQGRRGQPELSLRCGGNERGVFGRGTELSLPFISVAPNRIPRYDGTDLYALGGGMLLVPRHDLVGSTWVADERTEQLDGADYRVVGFRPRIESGFTRIERWTAVADGVAFWKTIDGQNATSWYGRTPDARIADPDAPVRIARWLLEETVDNHGNKTRYAYKPEDAANIPVTIYNQGRDHRANRYPERIYYGNYVDGDGAEQFAFEVLFDYGEYDLPSPVPQRTWPACADPFSEYRTGYEVRTYRRCRAIAMVHHFPAELGAAAVTVAALHLGYEDSDAGALLVSAQRIGYRRADDGTYEALALPATTLAYTPRTVAPRFEPLVAELAPIPGLPGGPGDYAFVDLYGDGIAGVLGTGGGALYYWTALGRGKYGLPRQLPAFPIDGAPAGRRLSFMDLDANGHLDLVVADPQRGGAYRNNNDGTWEPYEEMRAYPPELADAAAELTDLDGDGRPDLLVAAGRTLRYYLSTGTSHGAAGYAAPVTLARPATLPLGTAATELALVTTANVFGDGLAHRVRVSSGLVEAWPNLGYGRFGAKVTLGTAPPFDASLTGQRVLVADLAGSGASDVILVYADHVDVYFNRGGNSFAPAVRVEAPFGIDDLDQLALADVTGSGVPNLVISKPAPRLAHYWLDVGEVRPYALARIANGLGLTTELEYRSSTAYYLADRAAGEPWVEKLAFPVQVLAKTATVDAISGTTSTRVFQYRDGYYDATVRAFTGFAYVQSQDTATFNPRVWRFPTHAAAPLAVDAPEEPALHRTWALTGAYLEAPAIAAQLAPLRWQGDPDAIDLPPYALAPEILAAGGETVRAAHRALAAHPVRAELFGVDGDGQPGAAPYEVTLTSWGVRLVQPAIGPLPAVFFVGTRESARSTYDQVADDPRIEHELALAYDAYGTVTRSARVGYARRPAVGRTVLPGQDLTATVTLTEVIDDVAGAVYLLGFQARTRALELGGVTPAPARYFAFAQLAAAVDVALAHEVAYGEPFTTGEQARVYDVSETYYWNAAQDAPLPLGAIAPAALVHHTQRAAFPTEYVETVYGARVDADALAAAGYVLAGGTWWAPGAVDVYGGAAAYYLRTQIVDPFGNATTYAYDAYLLDLVSTTDALGQTTTAAIDYHVMQPAAVVSVNGNTTAVLFDPLGEVIVATLYGEKAGEPVGNAPLSAYVRQPPATVAEVLADPAKYLQGASSFFCYQLDAWAGGQPISSLALVRADWLHWPAGSAPPPAVPPAATLEYFDGSLRLLARVAQVEGAAAGTTGVAWAVGEQSAYNQRGERMRGYFPYYGAGPGYTAAPASPVTTFRFDALGRPTRTELPSGATTRIAYAAWAQQAFDEDDTDPDSPFFDTPATSAFAATGAVVQETRITTQSGGAKLPLHAYFVLDIAGNRLRIIDPRFYDAEHPEVATSYAFVDQYDMRAQRLSSQSADAGLSLVLVDVTGATVAQWDGRGNATAIAYDVLRRPVSVTVTSGGVTRETERIEYGTDAGTNSVGEVAVHDDQAGVLAYPAYDLLGNARRVERRVLASCGEVNWQGTPALLPETWTIDAEHDSANRLVREVNADGSVVETRLYRNGWPASVVLDGAAVTSACTYTAGGLPLAIAYGNGMAGARAYEPLTLRLATSVTSVTDAAKLQDLAFGYDPVGNVVSVDDRVASDTRAYTYDAIYQLVGAAGMQGAGEPFTETYAYDRAGNLVEQTHTDAGGTVTTALAIAKTSNRGVLASILGGDDPDAFFDESGNQRSVAPLADGRRLAWDYRNRLASADDAGGGVSQFLYDSGGTRVRKLRTQGGATTADAIYIGRCVFERGTPDRELRVLATERLVLVVRTTAAGAQLRYQLHDQVASVTVEAGADASVLTREAYFPYGTPSAASAADPADLADKRYRFNGKERDDATAFYDYGQRYYAPWQMRWLSADPAGTVDGLNLFAFVTGNPTTRYDAHGTNGDDENKQPQTRWRPPLWYQSVASRYASFVTQYRTQSDDHRGLVYTFKSWSYFSALANAAFEITESRFHHNTPGALLSLSQAAHAAFFGGLFGLAYPAKSIYKSVSNKELPSRSIVALFTANALYTLEGFTAYRSIYRPGLTPWVGGLGFSADLLKVYYYLKNDDPKNATTYSLFSLGNLAATGKLTRLPPVRAPQLLALGLLSTLIPSEYYNYPYFKVVKPTFDDVKLRFSNWWKNFGKPPPGGHWTESHNVLMDNLRLTINYKTPRKK